MAMHPIKAPGPYGFSTQFYSQFWCQVGPSVSSFVHSCMEHDVSFELFNKTFLTLIPKRLHPFSPIGYRQISLRNAIYKILDKVWWTNWSKICIQSLERSNLLYFKVDWLLIALFCPLRLFTGCSRPMMVKLDITKAYDCIEWDFLHAIMIRIHFPHSFITLLFRYIGFFWIQILLNGSPAQGFVLHRGIDMGILSLLFCFSFVLKVYRVSSRLRPALVPGMTLQWRDGLRCSHICCLRMIVISFSRLQTPRPRTLFPWYISMKKCWGNRSTFLNILFLSVMVWIYILRNGSVCY